MESVVEVGSKAISTVLDVVEHPILSVEHGYETIRSKLIDVSEDFKAEIKDLKQN